MRFAKGYLKKMAIPDNYDLWEAHEARQQKLLEALPVCDHCGNPIQDEELIDFDGFLLCQKCLRDHYTKKTEDYTA